MLDLPGPQYLVVTFTHQCHSGCLTAWIKLDAMFVGNRFFLKPVFQNDGKRKAAKYGRTTRG